MLFQKYENKYKKRWKKIMRKVVTQHEVRSWRQKRATAHNQDEIDRYILVRKMDRNHLLRLQSILIQSGRRESEMVRSNKKKRRKKETDRKKQERKSKEREREKDILHPSRYILQTTKHCSGATIRGQALSQDHPFPPSVPSSIPLSTWSRPKHSRRQEVCFIFLECVLKWFQEQSPKYK